MPHNRNIKNIHDINDTIFSNLQNKFNFFIINNEIKDTIKSHNQINFIIINIKYTLNNIMDNENFKKLTDYANAKHRFEFDNVKLKHQKKLEKWRNSKYKNAQTTTNNDKNWLVNLTNIHIPDDVKSILELGKNSIHRLKMYLTST